MLKNEQGALEKFKAEGWTPIRNGWPDYLLIRTTTGGELEFMGVEVKHGNDALKERTNSHARSPTFRWHQGRGL